MKFKSPITPKQLIYHSNLCPTGWGDCSKASVCENRELCLSLCSAVPLPYINRPNTFIVVRDFERYELSSYCKSLVPDLIESGWHWGIDLPYVFKRMPTIEGQDCEIPSRKYMEVVGYYGDVFCPPEKFPLSISEGLTEVICSVYDCTSLPPKNVYIRAEQLPYEYSLKHKCLVVFEDWPGWFYSACPLKEVPKPISPIPPKDWATVDACTWADLTFIENVIPF